MERIKQRLDWLKDHKHSEQVVRSYLICNAVDTDGRDRDTLSCQVGLVVRPTYVKHSKNT